RLHIDGLASPMRAKIKDSHPNAVTVGSDLGFLQVGRSLELEDASSGNKRPASIDRVEVAVDADSRVPQLVVTLRYTDLPPAADGNRPLPRDPRASITPDSGADDLAAIEEASARMRGAFARQVASVGPALARVAQRAKTTVGLLAKKRVRADEPASVRRTTAPAFGGGLHASGRRVVRGDGSSPPGEEGSAATKSRLTKRKAAMASAVMLVAIAGALALKKSHHDPAPEPVAVAPTESPSAVAAGSAVPNGVLAPAAPGSAPSSAAPPVGASPLPETAPANHEPSATLAAGDDGSDPNKGTRKHHVRPAPFGNGPVHHGNVLRLKMDAPIEVIQGAQQPMGFAIKLPGRKSLEAAGPLAARDSRIAAIKVSNDPSGAELTVTFRDGVPNYQVTGRGDNLVIRLAQVGTLDTTAKRDSKSLKHRK
ncbi:MAG: hypothetical protein M3O50_03190, partial [Myxococcota bacterium]|nr:hypothetical protein [Myxococcota bacterium]